MSHIVAVTESDDFRYQLLQAAQGVRLSLAQGPMPASPAALFAQLADPEPPTVVVLDAGEDVRPALELAAQLSEQCPVLSLLLVTTNAAEIGLEAMRAGVRDVIDPTSGPADIRAVLERALVAARSRAAEPAVVDGAPVASEGPTGRVISVVSPKGGVGKTTVATNLAVGLARTGHHSTVLVDLDVQFGDVASALDLDPEYAFNDAVQGPASRDTMLLKTFLTLHETGLYVLCGPKTPVEADVITAAHVTQLIQMLASEFAYVVLDTAPGLSELVLAAMDQTTDLVLVTSMDVPGVRGLRKELDALTELGMGTNRTVVVNFADPKCGLSTGAIETTLRAKVDVLVPRSKATLDAVNQGNPVIRSTPKDAAAKQLNLLVSRFAPAPLEGAIPLRQKDRAEQPTKHAISAPKRAAPRWYRVKKAAS